MWDPWDLQEAWTSLLGDEQHGPVTTSPLLTASPSAGQPPIWGASGLSVPCQHQTEQR